MVLERCTNAVASPFGVTGALDTTHGQKLYHCDDNETNIMKHSPLLLVKRVTEYWNYGNKMTSGKEM